MKYAETDATVLVATPRGGDKEKEAWEAWSGVDAARESCGETFLGASLHECVDAASAYRFVVRTELGGASDEAVAAATEAARAAAGDGAIVGAYRCAFNIEKEGAPAGALPAVREVQKKQREAKEQGFKNADEPPRLLRRRALYDSLVSPSSSSSSSTSPSSRSRSRA